jgi:DNA-binding MarR family transcriptional regulator
MADPRTPPEPHEAAIADARFLMRRAFRMIDDEARKLGIDPLAHQLLVQLRGAPALTHTVSELAVRLDIPLNLASRLAADLDRRGLVERLQSPDDGRVRLIRATDEGIDLARRIGDRARVRFTELQHGFSAQQRRAALQVWAGNLGVELAEDATVWPA